MEKIKAPTTAKILQIVRQKLIHLQIKLNGASNFDFQSKEVT